MPEIKMGSGSNGGDAHRMKVGGESDDRKHGCKSKEVEP